MIPIGYNVWEMYGKSLLFSPRNVHFTLSKMTIANQTQLTSICFGCDRAALSASSLVGELSVTLRDLPHTLFGSLASNAAPMRPQSTVQRPSLHCRLSARIAMRHFMRRVHDRQAHVDRGRVEKDEAPLVGWQVGKQ